MVLHLKDEEFGWGDTAITEGTENEASVTKLQTSKYQK